MAYGINDEIEKLVYGGTKSSTPVVVQTSNNVATSIINSILNINENIADPSPRIVHVCELLAAELVRTPKLPRKEIVELAEILLGNLRDSGIPSEAGPWGNMRFI